MDKGKINEFRKLLAIPRPLLRVILASIT